MKPFLPILISFLLLPNFNLWAQSPELIVDTKVLPDNCGEYYQIEGQISGTPTGTAYSNCGVGVRVEINFYDGTLQPEGPRFNPVEYTFAFGLLHAPTNPNEWSFHPGSIGSGSIPQEYVSFNKTGLSAIFNIPQSALPAFDNISLRVNYTFFTPVGRFPEVNYACLVFNGLVEIKEYSYASESTLSKTSYIYGLPIAPDHFVLGPSIHLLHNLKPRLNVDIEALNCLAGPGDPIGLKNLKAIRVGAYPANEFCGSNYAVKWDSGATGCSSGCICSWPMSYKVDELSTGCYASSADYSALPCGQDTGGSFYEVDNDRLTTDWLYVKKAKGKNAIYDPAAAYRIYSSNGVLMQAGILEEAINIERLSSNIYFLQIQEAGKTQVLKFFKR